MICSAEFPVKLWLHYHICLVLKDVQRLTAECSRLYYETGLGVNVYHKKDDGMDVEWETVAPQKKL